MTTNDIAFDAEIIQAEENFLIDIQFLIQELIDKKGMSRSDLAVKAKISKARLSQLLGSEANPTVKSIVGIFHALGEEPLITSRKKSATIKQIIAEATAVPSDWSWDSSAVAETLPAFKGSPSKEMVAVVKEAVASNDNYRRQVLVWDDGNDSMSLEAA